MKAKRIRIDVGYDWECTGKKQFRVKDRKNLFLCDELRGSKGMYIDLSFKEEGGLSVSAEAYYPKYKIEFAYSSNMTEAEFTDKDLHNIMKVAIAHLKRKGTLYAKDMKIAERYPVEVVEYLP